MSDYISRQELKKFVERKFDMPDVYLPTRLLKEAIDNFPAADVWPAWRSTETDPPKIGEPVLIARKIRHNETVLVEPAVLRPDGTWKAIGHKIKPSSVRHWMPMPEPPKESEI